MKNPEQLPLAAAQAADRIIAFRPEGPITVAQFIADATRLAEAMPAAGHILNICQDRYRFMVGLAAGLLADKTSLLPANHTPETIRQLLEFAPDVFCLHDGNGEDIALPQLRYPPEAATPDPARAIPDIDADRTLAYLFTSGSTGTPVPHKRTWGAAVRSGRAEAAGLGLGTAAPFSIVGTVPAQHSYGLESTILLSLHGNCAAWCGRPFYPADIASALAAVPRPRLLVTTPFHLRSLLESGVEMPAVDRVLSATAPLSRELAVMAEERLGAPVHEIYGCTEAGQLASRHTAATDEWTPLPGVSVTPEDEGHVAHGGHVEGRIPLSDFLQSVDGGRFILHGRNTDLINIAGKRTSLAYLDHQLNAIAGVADGCFFMPDEAGGPVEGVSRLCAFVVAPGLDSRQLLAALRQRIDPIFLPRPLIFLDSLARNATAKLVRSDLQALYERHRKPALPEAS